MEYNNENKKKYSRYQIEKILIKLLDEVDNNLFYNISIIEKSLDVEWKSEKNETLLHVLIMLGKDYCSDIKLMQLTCSLMECGIDVNTLETDNYLNFIQLAIEKGYNEKYILNVIRYAVDRGLNVNSQDINGYTMLHTAISFQYAGSISELYCLLDKCGYDSSIEDNLCNTAVECYELFRYFDDEYEEELKKIKYIYGNFLKKNDRFLNELKDELSKFGRVLNNVEYNVSPTIGRDRELEILIVTLAQKKKSPILVGDSGVGKTSIVDELCYRIQNDNVPLFLKDRLILEVRPNSLVAGKSYVGEFQKALDELINICIDNNVILFIDELHTIYGTGSSSNDDNDMASILLSYLERFELKVIGATTKIEYDKYFSDGALKRRFHSILIDELSYEKMKLVVDKVIRDFGNEYEIYYQDILNDELVEILLTATRKESRVYFDVVNNPDLVISIIDRAYAYALCDDDSVLNKSHIINAINDCDRISSVAKEEAKLSIDYMDINNQKNKCIRKIIPFSCRKS